jgi:hypothetical protein
MKRILLLIIAALAIVIFYQVFCSGTQAELFMPGRAVLPAPSGSLIAVEVEKGEWGIHAPARTCLGTVNTAAEPLWVDDEEGARFLYLDGEGLHAASFIPEFSSRLLIPNRSFLPWRALSGGRILLAFVEDDQIRGFALTTMPLGSGEEILEMGTTVSWLGEPPAVTLEASPDGRWVSRAVRAGDLFKIGILEVGAGVQSREEKWVLHRVNSAEHFWSWSGRFLLYSSAEGSVELFDTLSGKSRWLVNSSFAPTGFTPFKPCFTRDDVVLFMEMVDRYGYRQIKQFTTATSEVTEFTQGGIDHYAPSLSWNGRYISYRQGRMPEEDEAFEQGSVEESLCIFDILGRTTFDLGDRDLLPGMLHQGPVLSGDLKHAFFVKENQIFRYPLPR